ncbi:MAG: hypothetical protein Q9219_004422 [cf. Caloplaca sp. 3 TL-2023]
MAKSRPSQELRVSRKKKSARKHLDKYLPDKPTTKKPTVPKESPQELLEKASALLQISQPEEAQLLALQAVNQFKSEDGSWIREALPALNLVAEIKLELGYAEAARSFFLLAASLDPDGSIPESQGGGAEKFLWLAQLDERGGHDSVSWFQKGAIVLRNDIASIAEPAAKSQKRKRLAAAFCGIIEIYMTDLSWEPDAESRCESLITEALLVAPDSPEVLQTLANIRISQTRVEQARKALVDSLELWKDLPADDEAVPEFAARISLSRLLMEAEMEDEALTVLERLIEEDDTSVEAWYLGGWCIYLIAEKRPSNTLITNHLAVDNGQDPFSKGTLSLSREWLTNSLRLFYLQDYEDERLGDHVQELLKDLNSQLGETKDEDEDEEGGEEEEDWESEEEGDEAMDAE